MTAIVCVDEAWGMAFHAVSYTHLDVYKRQVLHMPCIIIRTNVEIPSDRAKELKTALAVSWEKVPTKRERWLMIVMEDKQQMFFSGRDTPAAFVNFKIHGDYDIGPKNCEMLSEERCV